MFLLTHQVLFFVLLSRSPVRSYMTKSAFSLRSYSLGKCINYYAVPWNWTLSNRSMPTFPRPVLDSLTLAIVMRKPWVLGMSWKHHRDVICLTSTSIAKYGGKFDFTVILLLLLQPSFWYPSTGSLTGHNVWTKEKFFRLLLESILSNVVHRLNEAYWDIAWFLWLCFFAFFQLKLFPSYSIWMCLATKTRW